MKLFTKLAIAAVCAVSFSSVSAQDRADLLWVIGDATPYGWSCDDATALEATADNAKIFTGTMYLEADKDFKFLTKYDFGNMEYRAASENATPGADGKVALVLSDSDPDNKIHVTESANYLITIDTEALEATIVKSEYQATQIRYASLFIVGSVLPTGYAVDNGLALPQSVEKPYEFYAENISLLEGDFKIATALKGSGTWDAKYWYFRDMDDASKIVLGAEGDNQWHIEAAGSYNVKVNLVDNTISIVPFTDAIEEIETDTENTPAAYYSVDGRRVLNPAAGSLVIRVAADGTATKIRF